MKYPADHLLLWGFVLHLVADWLLQNEWMSVNKAKRRQWTAPEGKWFALNSAEKGERVTVSKHMDGPWWDRHPAAYIHAGIHGAVQLLIFPWWAALLIAATHLIIDTRTPVEWWSKLIRQTQPDPSRMLLLNPRRIKRAEETGDSIELTNVAYDIGTEVRIWADQVCHVVVIALVALVVAA